MAQIHQSSPSDASLAEGFFSESGSFDDSLQHYMDIKFTQLQDDVRFRRSANISEQASQEGFVGITPWQDELAEHRQAPKLNRTNQASWINLAAPEFISGQNNANSQRSQFPLYNYLPRRTIEKFPTTGSLPQLTDCTHNEGYYRPCNSAPMQSSEVLVREMGMRRTMETPWNPINRHLDHSYNDPRRNGNVFLKILATQLVSGTIIGRGGKGLNWFRRKSKVDDIMISMPWELYPKTEYRTLFLKGVTKAVVKATCIIADLMLSKYNAQYSTTLTHNDRMIVLVVLPLFFRDAMEKIKEVSNPDILSITLFHSSEEHQEIVAVIKGLKVQVKELVATIANSIAEHIDFKDYCHVAYPGPEGVDVTVVPKDKIVQDLENLTQDSPKEQVSSRGSGINRAEGSPPANTAREKNPVNPSDHENTDVETDCLPKTNSNDHVNNMEECAGLNAPDVTQPRDCADVAAVAEDLEPIKNYKVNINIVIPAAKVSDVLAISKNSNCYVTTAQSEQPDSLALSISGPYSETVSIVTRILTTIST